VTTVLSTPDLTPARWYQLLTSLVVPRPIAWVSTVAADGTPNLAPHSFFTVASSAPPVIAFTSIGEKDTLRNIRATGRFTVSVVGEGTWADANATSCPHPPGVDEFVAAGVAAQPGATHDVPVPAASPAHLECSLREVVPVGNAFLVLGDVQAFVLADGVADESGRPAIAALAPAAKLGADEWALLAPAFSEPRPTYQG
jgi:flavin reductase (DIM6/NTAB) family NADH-FMN oxidoreductase RutF